MRDAQQKIRPGENPCDYITSPEGYKWSKGKKMNISPKPIDISLIGGAE